MIKAHRWSRACGVLVAAAALWLALPVAADFEVIGPDGRRILLKEDGTWWYLDGKGKQEPKEQGKEPSKEAGKEPGTEAAKGPEKPKIAGEAVLNLERRVDGGGGCIFGLRLVNSFPYLINSFVPTFSAIRSTGVVYDSVLSGFQGLKPGDSQSREIIFKGISCQEIAHLQVSGGDRCVAGDLDRFSLADGECLKRVRIVPSSLVRFDK